MKVKGFSWVGVASDDFPRSLAFFTEVMGLTVETLGDDQVGSPGTELEFAL